MAEPGEDRELFSRQLRVDAIVDRVLNHFDKHQDGGDVKADLRARARNAPEDYDEAIARLERLSSEYPQDSIARAALDLLRVIRGSITTS